MSDDLKDDYEGGISVDVGRRFLESLSLKITKIDREIESIENSKQIKINERDTLYEVFLRLRELFDLDDIRIL